MIRAFAYAGTRRLGPGVSRLVAAARRNRVAVALVYLTLLVAIAWANVAGGPRLFQGVGRIAQTLDGVPGIRLVVLLVAGTAGQVVLARSRSRWLVRTIAVAVVLSVVPSAVALASLRPTSLSEDIAGLGAGAALAVGVVVLATRGGFVRAKELAVVGLCVATGALLPISLALAVGTDRTAAASAAVALLLGATWSLGALAAYLFLAPPAGAPAAVRTPARGPRAHVAAARTFALVLLAPVYLGFDLARFVRVGDEASAVARKALVFGVAASAIDRSLSGDPPGKDARVVAVNEVVPGIGVVRGAPSCEAGRCAGAISLDTPDGKYADLFDADATDVKGAIARAHTSLVGTAVFTGAPAAKDATDRELYVAIRDKVQSRTVRVPIVELELGAARAHWALGAVVLVILVLVRNRLGAAMRDGGQSDDEPWLLLDTGDRLERAIAAGYFVAVVASSTAVAASLLLAVSRAPEAGVLAAIAAFWASGVALSLSIASRLLALRARRLLPPAAVAAPAPRTRRLRPPRRSR